MLNKEMLVFSSITESFTDIISGAITSGQYNDIYFGYSSSSQFGSCTNERLTSLFDDFSGKAATGNGASIDFVDERFTTNSVCSGKFKLTVDEFYQCEGWVIQRVSTGEANNVSRRGIVIDEFADVPKYVIGWHANGYDSCTVVFCNAISWPQVVTQEELTWLLPGPFRNLSFSDTYLEPGTYPYALSFGTGKPLPHVGFETGKTYDFKLEYKIDAIITEDGVQTF